MTAPVKLKLGKLSTIKDIARDTELNILLSMYKPNFKNIKTFLVGRADIMCNKHSKISLRNISIQILLFPQSICYCKVITKKKDLNILKLILLHENWI